jgi:hypothetical protein
MFGHDSLLPLAARRAVTLLPLLSETEWVADLPVPSEILTMRFRQKSVWLLFAAGWPRRTVKIDQSPDAVRAVASHACDAFSGATADRMWPRRLDWMLAALRVSRYGAPGPFMLNYSTRPGTIRRADFAPVPARCRLRQQDLRHRIPALREDPVARLARPNTASQHQQIL